MMRMNNNWRNSEIWKQCVLNLVGLHIEHGTKTWNEVWFSEWGVPCRIMLSLIPRIFWNDSYGINSKPHPGIDRPLMCCRNARNSWRGPDTEG
jgi:hypothetical protein